MTRRTPRHTRLAPEPYRPPRVHRFHTGLVILLGLCAASCSRERSEVEAAPGEGGPGPAALEVEVDAWRAERRASLTRPDGWLTLAGLHWIRENEITFGADPENDFVYAGAPDRSIPARIGTFHRTTEGVSFRPAEGVVVESSGQRVVDEIDLGGDEGEPPVLRLDSLEWFLIRRGDRMAIRLRDSMSPVRTGFLGIRHFPVEARWRLEGRFVEKVPPDTIQIPNVMGGVNATPSPASVVFEVDGEEYNLDLWKDATDPANFFTAFADGTNGADTYGGGRFLWVDAPDATGHTVVNFNQAYNPPCVFTEFATCPLPPRQNRLPFPVEAGEMTYLPPDGLGGES